ncbi:MAG: hypothetical protein KBS68_00775 [Clostridiales bacterium]|nr:hypothetical protein [Candidatus Crickella merdequi]
MNKDELTISRIQDIIERTENNAYLNSTGFLDSHEQALARRVLRTTSEFETFLWGGYDDADRRIVVSRPTTYECPYHDLLAVIRVEVPKGARRLTHRDYLGSILSLGIERRVIGDILVNENGADIICLSEIMDYLLNEYRQIGRNEIKATQSTLDDLRLPELRKEIIRETVPSTRLDNVVSSAFKISRSNAVNAIKSGIVSVDHIEAVKPDQRLEDGAVLVLKGKGKAVLREVGGESKKGRIWIIIDKYV